MSRKTTKKKTTKIQEKMFYVYCICLNDEIVYIGSTNDFERRAKEHMKTLEKGSHTNKTLQKLYNSNKSGTWTMECLLQVPSDSQLLQFFSEFLVNSYYQPICNRCVLSKGRSMITLPRVQDKQFCKDILDFIGSYYVDKENEEKENIKKD